MTTPVRRTLAGGLAAGVAVGLLAYVTAGAPSSGPASRPPRPEGPQPRRFEGGPPRGPAAKPPIPKDDAEKKILEVLDDMYRNQRRGMMNVSPDDGRFLRLMVEAVAAKHVVEVGTSNGYSGIWICLALRSTGGRLTTHEINAGRAALARENFKRAGVDQIVTLVEGDAHKEVPKIKDPIDVLFLDADKEGYIDYLKKLMPLVKPGGLVLAHNARDQGGAMKDFLEAVMSDPAVDTIFLRTEGAGISVTLKKR